MSDMSIPDHWQTKYADTFQSRLQQRKTRLAQFATIKQNPYGKVCFLDQIEAIELDQKTSRHEKSQMTEVVTNRRAMTAKTFTKMVGFDEDDDIKLGTQSVPMPQAAQELMSGGQRAMDQTFIDGIGGTNQVGTGGSDLLTTEAFPAANEIAVTVGAASGNSNLPLEKLYSAVEDLMVDEAFGETLDGEFDMPCLAISPSQYVDLIRQDRIASNDYNGNNNAIVIARLEKVLNCKILVSNKLAKTGNVREVLIWNKNSVQFGLWKKQTSRLFFDEESGGLRNRVHMMCGAARTENKGIRKLFCDETIKSSA